MPTRASEDWSASPQANLSVFLFTLSLRLVYLFEIRQSPIAAILVGDAYFYDKWAQRVASGDWLGTTVFYQTPLYPYFLAISYFLFGHSLLVVRVIQAVLGAAACSLLVSAGRRFFSPRVGFVGGLLLAIYAPAILFDGLIQKAALDAFLVCLVLWLAATFLRRVRWQSALAIGLTLSLLSLNRENAIVLAGATAVWLIVHRASNPLPRRLLHAGILIAGVGLVLVPVGLRNLSVGGEFFLTTSQMGPNLYIGNNESATGQYAPLVWGHASALNERDDAFQLAEAAVGRSLSPREVSRYWVRRAVAFAAAHPGAWLKLTVRKCLLVWNRIELMDSDDPGLYADDSITLRTLQAFATFGTLAPIGVVGICLTWPDRRRLWLLYLFVASITAAVALFYVLARYRYPLVPMLLLFAAAACWKMADAVVHRDVRRVVMGAAIATLAALVVNATLVPPAESRATGYYNLGVALSTELRFDEAQQFYARSLAISPAFAEARLMLGNALVAQNKLDEAVHEFRAILDAAPDNAVVHHNLGVALAKQGKSEQALYHFREAARLDASTARAPVRLP